VKSSSTSLVKLHGRSRPKKAFQGRDCEIAKCPTHIVRVPNFGNSSCDSIVCFTITLICGKDGLAPLPTDGDYLFPELRRKGPALSRRGGATMAVVCRRYFLRGDGTVAPSVADYWSLNSSSIGSRNINNARTTSPGIKASNAPIVITATSLIMDFDPVGFADLSVTLSN
jgi:hypothetical protein